MSQTITKSSTAGDISGQGKSVSSFNVNVTNTVSGQAYRVAFLVVGHNQSGTAPTLSGGAGLTWTQRQNDWYTANIGAAVYTAPFTSGSVTAGNPLTVVNGTSLTGAGIALIFDGVDTVTTYDATYGWGRDGSSTNSTGPVGPPGKTSIAGEARIGFVAVSSSTGYTAPLNSNLSLTECTNPNFLPAVNAGLSVNWVGQATGAANDLALHVAYSIATTGGDADAYSPSWGVSSVYIGGEAGALIPGPDIAAPTTYIAQAARIVSPR